MDTPLESAQYANFVFFNSTRIPTRDEPELHLLTSEPIVVMTTALTSSSVPPCQNSQNQCRLHHSKWSS